jgi:hypothetical protein
MSEEITLRCTDSGQSVRAIHRRTPQYGTSVSSAESPEVGMS